MVEADKEQDDGQRDLVDGGPQQQGERSRKRNRKKGRQHGEAAAQVAILVLRVVGFEIRFSGSIVAAFGPRLVCQTMYVFSRRPTSTTLLVRVCCSCISIWVRVYRQQRSIIAFARGAPMMQQQQ